ncbi:leucine-rich repeat domain-containing protein [Noviherbaspirillum pedocola]|uniref:Uncharacterized protein n=1 Tax=Noviherbaspirillum pedocola TaxID=2801341 RepID=A0A934SPS6_9BURK|nr:hypothetical protein [Noviherbaspirillum pedocola]MBK4733297.1 hypothetical protein [Noviherbaspirillum pedocola]
MDRIAGSPKLTPSAQAATSELSPDQQRNSSERAFSVDQLHGMPVPPQDHPHFEMPAKSDADDAQSSLEKEVDLYRAAHPMYEDEGFDAAGRLHEEALKVSRETVQKFFAGEVPPHDDPRDLRPLVLFLVKNNMPNAISWLAVHADIGKLDLTSCSLGDADMQTLADWLRTCPKPMELDLHHNNIGPDGVMALAVALRESGLTSLDLGNNRIGNDGVRALCQNLPSAPRLQELRLQDVGMDNDGVAALADALPVSELQKLSISDTDARIDNAGAGQLAKALGNNPALKQIRLVFSGVTDEGWTQIARSLKSNTQLQGLNINATMQPESARDDQFSLMLADALRSNRTLQNLKVVGIDLSRSGAAALAASIRSSASLVNVSWPRSPLAEDVAVRGDRGIDS